jgi:hypothetical protein
MGISDKDKNESPGDSLLWTKPVIVSVITLVVLDKRNKRC